MNDNITEKIVEKIRKNRVSTTEIADCLGKTGHLPGVTPLNSRHFRVGPVFFAYAFGESNYELHNQLERVSPGDIVVVKAHECGERAVFGDLVSKQLLLYQEAAAIVVDGYLRDAHKLKKENNPIWCIGVTPIGCFNRKNKHLLDQAVLGSWKREYEGTIAVCDDSGVVVIPEREINDNFLKKLDFIEAQEDAWYHCLDRLRWSTYKTVCLKAYLTDPTALSDQDRERLIELKDSCKE